MKKTVLLFGGRSAEHEVSVSSAAYLYPKLRARVKDLLPVYIDKSGALYHAQTNCPLTFSYQNASLSVVSEEGLFSPAYAVSLLHGTYGEDGAWQGLFALANIPIAGSGVLASAAAMHKPTAKRLAASIGIPTVKGLCPATVEAAEETLSYPMFVKPSSSGSSLGAQKAANKGELCEALRKASAYGEVMAEEYIPCRELTVAVYEKNGNKTASMVGEILPHTDFYDYEAKYTRSDTTFLCPAPIDDATAADVRRMAIDVFALIGAKGFARIDFFLSETGKLYFNEINTLPGYTEHSLFPLLLEKSGVDPLTPFEEAWA